MTSADPPGALAGRSAELALLRSFLRSDDPGALTLTGEPGVGKSALLDAAAELAVASGMRVLRATGTEFEAGVSFAGLHQALLPVQGGVERLDPPHRWALSAALGLGATAVPSLESVSAAVSALLSEEVLDGGVVLIVDDAPWIDRASSAVLARLVLPGAVPGFRLLLSARAGEAGFFRRVGRELDVPPLSDAAASELIRRHFPGLAEPVRRRILAVAAGNPLALLELPGGLGEEQRASSVPLPTQLPLTRRLSALYAARIRRLPDELRRLLLLSALHDAVDLRPLLRAAAGAEASRSVAAAESVGLLTVESAHGRITFRHPLVRHGLVEASTSDDRRQAHRELAELLPGDLERIAWHRAEATVQPDVVVSALLEQAAGRARRRGDALGAVTALLRSAALSPQRTERARRLSLAAYVGADVTGDLRQASRLLLDAQQVDPQAGDSLDAAMAASYLLLNGEGDLGTAHGLLAGAIESEVERNGPDSPGLAEALHNLLEICLYGARPELWETFYAALGHLSLDRHPVLALWVAALADPVRTGASVLDVVEQAVDQLQQETDLTRIERMATAMIYVDRVDDVRSPLFRAVTDAREGGAVTSGINALMLLSVDAFKTGRWEEGARLAEEGVELCDRHGYRLLAWPLELARGLIAAGRGADGVARAVADRITTWAGPRGVLGLQNYAAHIRSLAALTRGDYQESYEEAISISPAGDFVPHAGHALWVCMDLVEAAVRGDRPADAAAHVAAMQEAGVGALSSRLTLLVAGSRAMAATGDAPELFERALRLPQAHRWPFDRARIQLFYGERLRRSRHPGAARAQLEGAESAFRRLEAIPWAERARTELLAAGPTGSPRLSAEGVLTAQEQIVASLAAVGLTNKQIAQRLQVSHRTVAAHLRQVFRKLDVPTRAGLRDGLDRVQSIGR